MAVLVMRKLLHDNVDITAHTSHIWGLSVSHGTLWTPHALLRLTKKLKLLDVRLEMIVEAAQRAVRSPAKRKGSTRPPSARARVCLRVVWSAPRIPIAVF